MSGAELAQLVALAESCGATVVRHPNAVVVVVPIGVSAAGDAGELLSLEQAREVAKLKSTRPLRDAARAGELALYGRQRSRTVKRGELLAWLEGRGRRRVDVGPDDEDVERRMARIARSR